jgi:predicted GNAT family acetyltransferase
MAKIEDNTALQRYELLVEGQVVFADYRRDSNIVHITHVETPVILRGSGKAGELMQAIADKARAENFKIHPICSYAVAWLVRHKDYADIVV